MKKNKNNFSLFISKSTHQNLFSFLSLCYFFFHLFFSAVKCVTCASGSYQDGTMNECAPCAAGKETNVDQSQCDTCTNGKVAPNSGSPSCTPCSGGTAALDVASACATCPAGTFSGNFANSCTPCTPGRFQSSSGSPSCSVCVGLRKYTSGKLIFIKNLWKFKKAKKFWGVSVLDTPFKKNLNSVSLTFLCIFYFSFCLLSSQTTILATFCFFFYVFLLHILNSKKKVLTTLKTTITSQWKIVALPVPTAVV